MTQTVKILNAKEIYNPAMHSVINQYLNILRKERRKEKKTNDFWSLLLHMDVMAKKVWGKDTDNKVVALAREGGDNVVLFELEYPFSNEHILVLDLIVEKKIALVQTIGEHLNEAR